MSTHLKVLEVSRFLSRLYFIRSFRVIECVENSCSAINFPKYVSHEATINSEVVRQTGRAGSIVRATAAVRETTRRVPKEGVSRSVYLLCDVILVFRYAEVVARPIRSVE